MLSIIFINETYQLLQVGVDDTVSNTGPLVNHLIFARAPSMPDRLMPTKDKNK